MSALAAAFALSFLVSLALESRPPALTALRAPWRALVLRLTLHTALYAGAFALSWRPWHAALVVCAVGFLFGAGSAMKRRILGEPVVFSDFALVRLAIRHPRLYYAERLAEPRALAVFAGLWIATALWFWLEPAILPPGGWPLLAVPPLVALGASLALRSEPAHGLARALVGEGPDLDRDVARLGLGATMTAHWLCWRRQARPSRAAAAIIAARAATPVDGPRVVVAIQCESFVDVSARGLAGPDLPAFRGLAREAVAWGRCRVPAEGAYTMRAEFGFLTGLPTEAIGFDAFDPYLRLAPYASASIARLMKAAGRRTVLIHPYDRRFFARDTLAPELGFERFVDEAAFSGAERVGPYVGDVAVGELVAAEIARAVEPTFLFVVTMENHGPWGPGRIAGVDDPAAQYAAHLRNADRMIGRVAEALRPAGGLLCLYGDHAPARTLHPDLPDRRSADYLVWDARDPRKTPSDRQDLDVDAVGRLLFQRAAGA